MLLAFVISTGCLGLVIVILTTIILILKSENDSLIKQKRKLQGTVKHYEQIMNNWQKDPPNPEKHFAWLAKYEEWKRLNNYSDNCDNNTGNSNGK